MKKNGAKLMMNYILSALLVLMLVGCDDQHAYGRNVEASPSALTYSVSSSVDNLTIDGVCTLREAWRAATTNAAVDSCPAGSSSMRDEIELPDSWDMSLAGADDNSLSGDLDTLGGAILLRCPTGHACTLHAHGIDRLIHTGNTAALALEGALTLTGGCSNGGGCTSNVSGSIASGGALYHNSIGLLEIGPGVVFTANTSGTGGGFAICASSAPAHVLEGFSCTSNLAGTGGCAQAHVAVQLHEVTITGNVAGTGGAWSQYNGEAILWDSIVTGNVASSGVGGGLAAHGKWGMTVSGQISMVGGTLASNSASGDGGGAWAGQLQPQGACLTGTPCRVVLDDVAVAGNTSDTSGGPTGSGGGIATGTGGRTEARGSTAIATNTDNSSPFAHDCSGPLSLYDNSTLGNATGCTVDDQRPPPGPVCGDSVVEGSEQCDSSTCCALDCTWSAIDTACDDADVCTALSFCDGAGACEGSGTVCGDDTLQSSCGEQCDDGNTTSNDGCSSSCQTEMCIAWE